MDDPVRQRSTGECQDDPASVGECHEDDPASVGECQDDHASVGECHEDDPASVGECQDDHASVGECQGDPASVGECQGDPASVGECQGDPASVGECQGSSTADCPSENTDTAYKLNRKIFVGNISYRVGTRKLSKFFRKFGEVEFCYIVQDHIKKWSKGIAFITFESEESVKRALQATASQLYLDQRQMRVKPAELSTRVTYWQDSSSPDYTGTTDNDPSVMDTDLVTMDTEDSHEPSETGSDVTVKTDAGAPVSDCGLDDTNPDQEADCRCSCINTLFDELFLKIFSFLSMRERIAIERVSWRWKTLVQKSWISLKKLHFRKVFRRFGGLTDKILNSVLLRCGSYLELLDLSASPRLLTDFSMDIIGKYCPDLRQLDLSAVRITNRSLQNLVKSCPHLQTVRLKACSNTTDRGLEKLLQGCPRLQCVDLQDHPQLAGQCFQSAGTELVVVQLNNCSRLKDQGITKLANHATKLEALHINSCSELRDLAIHHICQKFIRLKVLDVGGMVMKVSSNALEAIGNLTQLEELDLSFNQYANDLVLLAVTNGCHKLRVLNVSGCHQGITDIGVSALSNLPCLNTLHLSYLNTVTDDSIKLLAHRGKLRSLVTRAASFMTDDVVNILTNFCPDLENIDLSGCFEITNRVFEAFKDVTDSNRDIVIHLGGTLVDWVADDVDWLAGFPHLKVSMLNLAMEDLRPDRELILPGEDDLDDDVEDIYDEHQPHLENFESARVENCYDWDEDYYSDDNDDFLDNDDPLAAERWDLS